MEDDQTKSNVSGLTRALAGMVLTLMLIMLGWLYILGGSVQRLIQHKEGHMQYHELEEKNCIAFRKYIVEKVEGVEQDCLKLEERINGK